MADKMEQLIKQYLETSSQAVSGKREEVAYPSSSELYRYLNDELAGAELERMLAFLRHDEEGQILVKNARRLMQSKGGWETEPVPSAELHRAKSLMKAPSKSALCPHCGKPITAFKKPLSAQRWLNLAWMALALGAFALSFVFRRYFMQFLALTVLAGVKALLEMRATKTQILIYKALSEDDDSQQHRLHQHSSRL